MFGKLTSAQFWASAALSIGGGALFIAAIMVGELIGPG